MQVMTNNALDGGHLFFYGRHIIVVCHEYYDIIHPIKSMRINIYNQINNACTMNTRLCNFRDTFGSFHRF